jgi:DNA-binding response OmpR family regulator
MGARILVVDDEPSIRDLFKLVLDAKGYESVLAKDVDDALTLFQEGGFDAVITDLDLKTALSGYDLCQRIYDSGKRLPIVMVTGSDPSSYDSFKPVGFNAEPYRTLSKPLPNVFYLTEVLAEALQKYDSIVTR